MIWVFGWSPDSTKEFYQIPGYVGGLVWTILFALMGYVYWQLGLSILPAAKSGRNAVTGLILFCLAFPFYTFGFQSPAMGIVGNLSTIAFAVVCIVLIARVEVLPALLLVPVVLWVSFATFLTATEM
jgi:translocator protein